MSNVFDSMPQVMLPNRTVVSAPQQASASVQSAVQTAAAAPAAVQNDTVEISTASQQKKGPIKSLKGFIANIKKFFSTTSEYVKGGAKGFTSGAVAASVVYTGSQIIKHFAKEGSKLKKLHSVPLSIITGAGVLASNIWTASLNATEKASNIEHRWTGHNK